MLRACLVAALGTAAVVAAEEAGTPPAIYYSGGSYVLEVTAEEFTGVANGKRDLVLLVYSGKDYYHSCRNRAQCPTRPLEAVETLAAAVRHTDVIVGALNCEKELPLRAEVGMLESHTP